MKDVLLYLFGLPGIFFVLFFVTSFYLFTSNFKKARTSCIILIVTVFLFSNTFMGRFLASFLVDNVEFKTVHHLTDIDMIVMPTNGVDYNGEIAGWIPNQSSFKAANVAYFLQAKLADRKVPVLMCGGRLEESGADLAESEIVRSYFAGQTAKVRKTLTETISKNLYEQAWQCANIIKQYNVKNPALVTSELKMLRTLALFRSRGVETIPFPVFVMQKERSGISEYLPSLDGLLLNRSVINEFIELALDFMNKRLEANNLAYTQN